MHEGHNWWCRPLALVVRNDLDVAVSEDGDAGIRGSEVDTHCILSRFARFLRGIFFGLPAAAASSAGAVTLVSSLEDFPASSVAFARPCWATLFLPSRVVACVNAALAPE